MPLIGRAAADAAAAAATRQPNSSLITATALFIRFEQQLSKLHLLGELPAPAGP